MDDALKQLLQSQFGITFQTQSFPGGRTAEVPYYNGQSLLAPGLDPAAVTEATTRNLMNAVIEQLRDDLSEAPPVTTRLDAVFDSMVALLPADEQAAYTQRFDQLIADLTAHPEAADEFIAYLRSKDNLDTLLQNPNTVALDSVLQDANTAVQNGIAADVAAGGAPEAPETPAGGAAPETEEMPFSRAAANVASQIVGEITNMGLVNPPMVDGNTVDWAQSTCIYAYTLISPPESYNSRAGRTDFDVFFNSVLREDHQEILEALGARHTDAMNLYRQYAQDPTNEGLRDQLMAFFDDGHGGSILPEYMRDTPPNVLFGMFFNEEYPHGLTGWYMSPEMIEMFIRHIDEGHPELYGPENSAQITGYRLVGGNLVPTGEESQMGDQFEAIINLTDIRDKRKPDPVEAILGSANETELREHVTEMSSADNFDLGEVLENMFAWLFGGVQQAREDFGRGA